MQTYTFDRVQAALDAVENPTRLRMSPRFLRRFKLSLREVPTAINGQESEWLVKLPTGEYNMAFRGVPIFADAYYEGEVIAD